MTMYEPEDLARYLTDATSDSWTVAPLPEPIYGQATAAYASNATTSMWAVMVDAPVFGRSLHVVANLSGEQHTCTIELRGHSIHDTICRAAVILGRHSREVRQTS